MEDADSVLVTGCQYGTSNRYMDTFIENNRSGFRPCHRHILHGMAVACISLAQPFLDTSISGLR